MNSLTFRNRLTNMLSLGVLAGLGLAPGCDNSEGSSKAATGGGPTGSGGQSASGGSPGSGGTPSLGGQSPTGGAATGLGGSAMGGSATSSGGSSGQGGSGSPTAGSAGNAMTTGGNATGGTTTAGGSGGATTAGAAGSGGANAKGGSGGAAGSAGKAGTAGASATVSFETKALSADHVAEGADIGDIDGDGTLDLVAGPIWYKGPSFAVGGTLFDPVPTYTRDQYSKFFLTFVDDLDGDTRPDVIGIGDAGGGNGSGTPNAHWYKNPGPGSLASAWLKYPLYGALVSNESPAYANLVGDARKELIFMTNRTLGYATPGATATAPWTFHAISGSAFNTPYVHGLGVGDIDGDGLADVVERSGWWKQPSTSGGTWQQHTVDFGAGLSGTRPGNWGGAQMVVFDVDGDGDSDVVSALATHAYGLSWFEQVDATHFTPHEILPPSATGMSFSQQHALSVADLNGDGLPDLVTGKRYYAHPSSNPDPGTSDPPVLYWFELSRTGGAKFTPRLIHNDSGAGCNFAIRDVSGDGKLDIFVSNKRGTFLHTQR